MATITSAASGNFADGATWVGGVKPTVGDTAVAATGHVVTIAASDACDELQNTGGRFVLAAGVTFTGIVRGGTGTRTLLYEAASPGVATVIGSVLGGTTNSTTAIEVTGTGTLGIQGAVTAGTTSYRDAIRITGNATVSVHGNVTGGGSGGDGSTAILSTGTNVVLSIVGDVKPLPSGARSRTVSFSGGALAITGAVWGADGPLASAGVVLGAGPLTCTVVGEVRGNAISPAIAAGAGGNNITVTGPIIAGSAQPGISFLVNGAGIIDVTGPIAAPSGLIHPIHSTNTDSGYVLLCSDLEDGNDGTVAVFARRIVHADKANHLLRFANEAGYPTGTKLVRASLDYASDAPAEGNVRHGVVYANSMYEGSCRVPPAASVMAGVPVDNTVGTAALTAQEVWEFVARTLTGGLTVEEIQSVVAEALAARAAASVESTGAQIAAADLR